MKVCGIMALTDLYWKPSQLLSCRWSRFQLPQFLFENRKNPKNKLSEPKTKQRLNSIGFKFRGFEFSAAAVVVIFVPIAFLGLAFLASLCACIMVCIFPSCVRLQLPGFGWVVN